MTGILRPQKRPGAPLFYGKLQYLTDASNCFSSLTNNLTAGIRLRSKQSVGSSGVFPVDDVTHVRARAVTDVYMCAVSFDEPELAAAVLGGGHGYLLSVQDCTWRLPLLP